MNDAAIVRGAIALDEAAPFELVEHPRNVGSTADEPRGEIERANGVWLLALEQTKRVVLLRGEFIACKEIVFKRLQAVVGSPESQERLLFQGIESPGFLSLPNLHVTILLG